MEWKPLKNIKLNIQLKEISLKLSEIKVKLLDELKKQNTRRAKIINDMAERRIRNS